MRKYTKEQLIFYLKKLNSILKKTPTIKDINQNKDFPSSTTYYKRFGSWNNALKEAGISINFKKYTREELLEDLRLLEKELNSVPMPRNLKEWCASYSTYRKYFGSWNNALKEANIHFKKTINLKKFSKKT